MTFKQIACYCGFCLTKGSSLLLTHEASILFTSAWAREIMLARSLIKSVFQPTARRLIRRLALGAASTLAYWPDARADCGSIPFNVSQPMIERIALDRDALKQMFPQGGDGLTFWVATVASSSHAALPSVIWTLKVGNENQREATIIGLARAAQQCEKSNKFTTRKIEQAVKNLSDASIMRKYLIAISGQNSPPSANVRSLSEIDKQIASPISTGFGVLPERKSQNGIGISLNNDEKEVPSIRAVDPYQKIR